MDRATSGKPIMIWTSNMSIIKIDSIAGWRRQHWIYCQNQWYKE